MSSIEIAISNLVLDANGLIIYDEDGLNKYQLTITADGALRVTKL